MTTWFVRPTRLLQHFPIIVQLILWKMFSLKLMKPFNRYLFSRGGFLSGYPIPRKKNSRSPDFHFPNPIPGISGFSEFFTRDFFGIFQKFQNPDPDHRDFGFFLSGFFRDFQIPIPIPGISNPTKKISIPGFSFSNPDPRDLGILHSGFPGFFWTFKIPIPFLGILGFFFLDFFGIFKSRSRSPVFRDFWDFPIKPKIKIADPEKIPSRNQLWFRINYSFKLFVGAYIFFSEQIRANEIF